MIELGVSATHTEQGSFIPKSLRNGFYHKTEFLLLLSHRSACSQTSISILLYTFLPVLWAVCILAQPDDFKFVWCRLFQVLWKICTLSITIVHPWLLCVIFWLFLCPLSCICPFCLFIYRTFPVVGLDVIRDTPALELRRPWADQASVMDARMVLEPVI